MTHEDLEDLLMEHLRYDAGEWIMTATQLEQLTDKLFEVMLRVRDRQVQIS